MVDSFLIYSQLDKMTVFLICQYSAHIC